MLSVERNGKYHGIYHVLHGRIDPLNSIGPDEIYIGQLLKRVKNPNGFGDLPAGRQEVKEIILATNPTMEGSNCYVHSKTIES